MKSYRSSLSMAGRLCLWTAFAAVAAVFVLATLPSRVSLLDAPMSFAKFVGQVDWRSMFADGEMLAVQLILVGAAAFVGAYSMIRSVLGRFGLALIGVVAPAAALTDRASEFLGWFAKTPYQAALWTMQALTGQGDGQFYRDGPFLMTAVGWWTFFCLVLVFRDGLLLLRTQKAAEAGAAPNGGPETPSGSSRVPEGPPSVS